MVLKIEKNLELCSDNTRTIINAYLAEVRTQMAKDSYKQYTSAINKFIEVHNFKELDTCEWNTIIEYRDYKSKKSKTNANDKKTAATINSQLNYLINFLKFTQDRFDITYSFEVEKINELCLPENDKREIIPFKLEDFLKLRQILKIKNLFHARFYIELVYHYGLSTNSKIGKYSIKQYDRDNKVFVFKGEKSKPASQQLDEAITYILDNNKFIPTSKEPFYHYVGEVEEYINRSIQIKDIVQTRLEHYIKCPRCGEHYLPTPDYWVLMEYEQDQSLWQICVSCYKEMTNNE